MPHNGDVAGLTTSDPPQSAKSFTATVTIVDSATELNASSTLLFNGISRTATKVSQILSKTSPSNGGAVEQNPTTVGAGETATVVFSSFNRLPVETLASCPAMGRFTAISGDKIVAAGSITVFLRR